MKQILLIACMAFLIAGCNSAENKDASKETAVTTTATPATNVELPYKLDKPYKDWQIGSAENTVVAMKSLKTFVDKDFAGLAATLADSVDVRVDGYQQKLSRDSAVKMFSAMRNDYNDLVITMYDYESVISADKKTEWVTLWYKQAWKDAKGKADSLSVIDDCKMENGKMAVLDEKIQHFQAKK